MIASVPQLLTLIDMFTNNQTTRVGSAVSLPADRLEAFARSYATTRLLEECIASCETLATELGPDPISMALQDSLSECIAACTGFLAATIRESRYISHYAMFCSEVCASTASACARRKDLASNLSEVLCRACANMVREDYAAVMAN